MLRYILAFILVIHGLIHFMGFAKAFGYANIPQLTKNIPKLVGGIWFGTTVLFMGAAVLLLFKKEEWWFTAFIAVVISEVLILTAWNGAKFGTIANVFILIFIIMAYAVWNFNSKYTNEVKNDLAKVVKIPDSMLIDSDLEHLPEPVKKYIRYTGSVGKLKVKNFRIDFVGKIRKDEQSPWMPFTSEQHNFVEASARLFFMKATMKNLPVAGFHSFKNGEAFMDIRLLSLFKVQYQSGKEMGIAETVTFFNDMCCIAPATLIDNRIQWTQLDSSTVNATFTNNGITISAKLFFNDKGELVNFISDDRYAADDHNGMKKIQWSTPLKDYQDIKGYRLAGSADAIYHFPEGDLCYGTFKLANIEYNGTE